MRVAASGVAGGGLGLWARAALAPAEVAAFIAGVRVPHIADAADADADADANADADADDDARGEDVEGGEGGEGGEAGKRGRGIDWGWAAPSVDGGEALTLTLTLILSLTLTPNPNP